ncbi:hypothetical protein Pcinc_034057 [Petrolisthes cinctipes]|uniref:Hexosyltransferase n=1 Tax=Petrolisthes cinctipes TaxID=88211 RepID=A0AAE1ER31_PETCI|nr:hypothetical protein Pcinc_034057 [Petrolisthes cinctipes]
MLRRKWIKCRWPRKVLAMVVMLVFVLPSIIVILNSRLSIDWLWVSRRSSQDDAVNTQPRNLPETETSLRNTRQEITERKKEQIIEPSKLQNTYEDYQQSATNELVTSTKPVQSPLPPANPRYPQQEFPFRYIINEPDLCDNTVNIINVIPTAPNNVAARHRIRKLWGRREVSEVTGIRTAFFLGLTSSTQLQTNISKESLLHGDIIQLSFIDSYRNLTLKTLSMLHWSLTYCPQAEWILKSDDDVFFNPFALATYIKENWNYNIICRMNSNYDVCRLGSSCPSKWVVKPEEYKYKSYPSYCIGAAYVISSSLAAKLYSAANKTHPFFIEDVYITGIIAHQFKPRYKKIPVSRSKIRKKSKTEKSFWNGHTLFLIHLHVNVTSLNMIWRNILESQELHKELMKNQEWV